VPVWSPSRLTGQIPALLLHFFLLLSLAGNAAKLTSNPATKVDADVDVDVDVDVDADVHEEPNVLGVSLPSGAAAAHQITTEIRAVLP
jgi:hypothetical protein